MESGPVSSEIVYVVYVPYLPLAEHAKVGPWSLIPRDQFSEGDATDADAFKLAEGLANIHELPKQPAIKVGAFAAWADDRVGADPGDMARISDLNRALVVTALDVNDSPRLPSEEKDPNAAHRSLTSDNAIVNAPGITRDAVGLPTSEVAESEPGRPASA